MKKISVTNILDNLFKFILMFFICLVWSLYFIKNSTLAIIFAILFAVIILFIFDKIDNKKQEKLNLNKAEQAHMEKCKNSFILMGQKKTLEFFNNLAKTKHQTTLKREYILINSPNGNIVLYPFIKQNAISVDTLVEIYNNVTQKEMGKDSAIALKKIIIVATSFDSACTEFLNNFNVPIIILDYRATYLSLLKAYEFYPEILIKEKPVQKRSFKRFYNLAFNKKRAKNYFVSALFIFFSSFFVMYRIYYLIIASTLFIFALFCQFKFEDKPQTENIITM